VARTFEDADGEAFSEDEEGVPPPSGAVEGLELPGVVGASTGALGDVDGVAGAEGSVGAVLGAVGVTSTGVPPPVGAVGGVVPGAADGSVGAPDGGVDGVTEEGSVGALLPGGTA
jgi:hypothetical protein